MDEAHGSAHRESAELQLICMNRNLSDHANPFKRTKKERHALRRMPLKL